MPTALTHALVPLAVGAAVIRKKPPLGFGLLTMGLAILPDIDTLGLRLGIPYEHFWGHRGFLHSPCFALVASTAATLLAGRWLSGLFRSRWRLWAFLGLVAVSHPLLDAMTDGGLGVALFSPFSNGRHFLPWRPIHVSPIGLRYLLTRWGLRTILSEMLWVWLPLAAFAAGCRVRLFLAGRVKSPSVGEDRP